jgi:hypothetical protein
VLTNTTAKTLVYGATGTHKTTAVGHFARYIHETTGKRTRLIASDANVEPIQDYIDDGIIEPIFLVESPDLLGIAIQLCRGFWPDETGKLQRHLGINDVGAYAWEGITSTAQLFMSHLAQKGQKIQEDVVGQFSEAGVKFGANPRSHYGFVPQQIYMMLTDLGSLPVERVLVTAHEGKGQDDFSKQLVYGPAAVGTAATNRIPPYVGDLFHFDSVEVGNATAKSIETRAYFRPHPDPQTKVLWPAKTRLRPRAVEAVQAQWPEGFIKLELGSGIDEYFRLQDSLKKTKDASG